MATDVCVFEDCDHRGRLRLGYCDKHYRRLKRHGDPTVVLRIRHEGSPEERAWQKIEAVTPFGCWQWETRAVNRHGYGIFTTKGRPQQAHRFMYTLLVGPIADGL